MNTVVNQNKADRASYVLIPCLSAGMGCVLKGAISGLLFAEMTGRTPLVYWHRNCKYLMGDAPQYHNAFLDYFESVCDCSLDELFGRVHSTYPEGVAQKDLHEVLDESHRTIRDNEKHFKNVQSDQARKAELLIFPARLQMKQIMKLIPEGHELYGCSMEEVSSWISSKYLKVQSGLRERVDHFWKAQLGSKKNVITVHVRRGDKYQESIMPSLSRYKEQVDRYFRNHPDAGFYLATDSSKVVDYFKKHYGDRAVTAPAIRFDGRQAVHKSGADGLQIGNEIVFDVECLSRGDHFVGFDESSVYFWVSYMTELGQKGRFTHMSVRSGIKEIISNRQSFKRAVKLQWKRVFGN
jgi:hypothetical protein